MARYEQKPIGPSVSSPQICLVLFLVTGCSAAFAADPKTFFANTDPNLSALPADGIFPHGQKMGYGLYTVQGQSRFDPSKTNIQRAAENGFTLVGPYYHYGWNNFQNIHAAQQRGLKFTYQIRPHDNVFGLNFHQRGAALSELTDAQIAASVRTQVEAILADPIAKSTVARWVAGPRRGPLLGRSGDELSAGGPQHDSAG